MIGQSQSVRKKEEKQKKVPKKFQLVRIQSNDFVCLSPGPRDEKLIENHREQTG